MFKEIIAMVPKEKINKFLLFRRKRGIRNSITTYTVIMSKGR
jgi:hypothetical protein